jgi:hypothetical protein
MQVAIEVLEQARLEQLDVPDGTLSFIETQIGQDATLFLGS